jgi:hypothetical protein
LAGLPVQRHIEAAVPLRQLVAHQVDLVAEGDQRAPGQLVGLQWLRPGDPQSLEGNGVARPTALFVQDSTVEADKKLLRVDTKKNVMELLNRE